jgi:hypothetical protein
VQLENIATPQEDTTPQLRYASLHRAVERGMASDEVFRELAEICLQLGHFDEALRVYEGMQPGSSKDHVASRLVRRGLIARPGGRPANRPPKPGRAPHHVVDDDFDLGGPSIAEHVVDSVQFLCQAHMPAVALLTMLAFPIIVGLGGFLTAGGSLWLFAGLATLPGLCVLGVVGAMGRQIFLQSAEGDEEIPAIPAPSVMLQAAKRHLGDVLIVLGVLIAPSLTLLWFEAPLVSSLPGLAIGMYLTPIALILRQVRGDIGSLSPVALIRGIGCCRGYSKVTAAFWLAFAPAAGAFWFSLGHAIWLQIAIVGPLAVLPTFATARLLGTFTESHRSRLGLLLYPQSTTTRSPSPRNQGPRNQSPRGQSPRSPGAQKPRPAPSPAAPVARRIEPTEPTRRFTNSPVPTQQQHTPLQPHAQRGPLSMRGTAPARPLAPRLQQSPQAAQKTPKPAPSVNLPPKPQKLVRKAMDSTPQPGSVGRPLQPEDWMTVANPRTAPAAHIEGRAPARPAQQRAEPSLPVPGVNTDLGGPDLSNLPGATIITGEDRERMGAASRKQ